MLKNRMERKPDVNIYGNVSRDWRRKKMSIMCLKCWRQWFEVINRDEKKEEEKNESWYGSFPESVTMAMSWSHQVNVKIAWY